MSRTLLIGLVLASQFLTGCYYSHLASGQLKLLWARQPIEEVLEDPEISPQVRHLLGLVGAVRKYAGQLGLEVGGQYTSYVDWPADRVVTTLVRTRPPSVEATPYWFPIVGSLPYKGYFDRSLAESEAERLREVEAFDVCVSGVSAYSTLGWMDDPVTSPMLRRGAASLVETLLHELVHATAFVAGDADFNESVAQFIGQEAAIAFFSENPDDYGIAPMPRATSPVWPDAESVRDAIDDRREVAITTLAFRDRLIRMAEDPNPPLNRIAAESEARAQLASLPLRVLDPERVAQRARLSNACLALRGTYLRDIPRHARVLAALDGDLGALIERLSRVAGEELSTDDYYDVSRIDSGAARLARSDQPRTDDPVGN